MWIQSVSCEEKVYIDDSIMKILYTIFNIIRDLEYIPKRFRTDNQVLIGNCPDGVQCHVLSVGGFLSLLKYKACINSLIENIASPGLCCTVYGVNSSPVSSILPLRRHIDAERIVLMIFYTILVAHGDLALMQRRLQS